MPRSFDQWLGNAQEFDLPALIKAAEWDASDAERRAHKGRGGQAVRRAEAQQLARQLGELLYFLRFCAKPTRVRPDDWLAYRPVAQRLVAKGQWKAEALEMFN